ncbi:MAG: response regulator [Gammaproteobacteria bacterium]|nr:response regulator [Gammaproteobacteria bacterium]
MIAAMPLTDELTISDGTATMRSMINILFIDDSRDDAELAALKLQRAGVTANYRRVATLADIDGTIGDPQWDIVLCDCRLPGFTALNVWTKWRELNARVPFAVFSDLVLNPEIRQLLDAGVHLFIDKNRLDELEPALRQFMRHTEDDQNQPLRRNGQ